MSLGGKGVDFFVTVVVFTVIGTLALLLRWWSARLQGRRFQVDDGLLIVAWIATLAYEATSIWTVFNGMGQPQETLSDADWEVQYKDIVVAMVCWTLATTLMKLAILFLYMRIFTTQSFRRWALVLTALIICFGVTYFGIAMTTCIPLSKIWKPLEDGRCRDLGAQEIGSMVPNIFLDICIIVLPMPWLWTLQMPLRNKIWITLMFSLGGINLGVMCYRLYAAVHPDADVSSGNATQGIFSFLELYIGVIVACMPTMAPIFMNYILPLITNVHSRIFGSGTSANDSVKMDNRHGNPVVNTFHREGPEARKNRSNFGSLDNSDLALSTYGLDETRADSGELHLMNPQASAHVQAECATTQDWVHHNGDGIYIQQGFQTQWNNV